MESGQKKIWFPAKRYGWGWGPPCAWQGWLVLLAFFAVIGGSAFLLLPKHPPAWFAVIAVSAAILLAICWLKGERPRWRWGGD